MRVDQTLESFRVPETKIDENLNFKTPLEELSEELSKSYEELSKRYKDDKINSNLSYDISILDKTKGEVPTTIKDINFAVESLNFNKFSVTEQVGAYAISQANAIPQNVLRLLQ
jgi:flagellin-like hook-associated protein FlgL